MMALEIKTFDGIIFHYKNGKLHREDGPAIIYDGDREEYWIDGIFVSYKS